MVPLGTGGHQHTWRPTCSAWWLGVSFYVQQQVMLRLVTLAALCLVAFAAPSWDEEINALKMSNSELKLSNAALEKRMQLLEEKIVNSSFLC